MKKTRLLWVDILTVILCVCAFVGVLAGCGSTKIKALKIANKEALTAEWTVGGTIRKIELAFEPESLNAQNVEYIVTSSDESIVAVDGLELKAVAAGTATITVRAEDQSDSVDITVKKLRPDLESVTIVNKAELEAEWVLGQPDRKIELAFAPAEYYSVENTNVNITLSNSTVKASGRTLQALGVGTALLTVSVGDLTDTVEINTSVTAPTIEAEDVSILAGDETALKLDVLTCDGQNANVTILNVSAGLTVDSDNVTVTAAEKGTYKLTLRATDGRDTSKYTDKEITVHVYRKLLDATTGAYVQNGKVENIALDYSEAYTSTDSEQTVKINTDWWVMGRFAAEASTTYYASVTFNGSGSNGGVLYGISHSAIGDNTHWLVSHVDAGAVSNQKNFKSKEIDMNDSTWKDMDVNVYKMWQLSNYRGITIANSFPIKFETVRIDDVFYLFINGQYVYAQRSAHFGSNPTVPGFIVHDATKTSVKLTGMEWTVNINEVQTKFAELTKDGIMSAYVPDSWASASNNPENFTRTQTTEGGYGYVFNKADKTFNEGMVSPYVYFDGDFTFEWDYKPTDFAYGYTSGNEYGSVLELRNSAYGESIIRFGVQFRSNNDGSNKGVRFIANGWGNDNVREWHETGYYYEGATDNSVYSNVMNYGTHLKIARKIVNGKASITYSIWLYENVAADGEQAYIQLSDTPILTYTYENIDESVKNFGSNSSLTDTTGALLAMWHNFKASGVYSNIRWTFD